MAKISRNFTAGKMNKTLDERVVPQGEYIDAMNVRMGSTEQSEVGVIENTKGNISLTALQFEGIPLSTNARTIGSIADGANETIYWFIHDSSFFPSPTNKIDMIVSFNETSNLLTYHVISINDGAGNGNTTLNFNPQYLITGVDLIDNLLFFTDDYNQPRFINTLKGYALPIAGLDDPLLGESILVIKRPPIESPDVELTIIGGQENYLEDRFICFAYRYEYENNEYSAISQFSAPAFFPQSFDVTNDAFLNEGMINQFNAAIVTVNTGGPLVKSIDLLFKDMNSNVIKVIEKVNKQELALSNNVDYTYTFSNSKIFTILPESELLRLYDNVPLKAKAQTIMGNRLMYGNYVEGYDLIDRNGNMTMLEYTLNGVSEEIGIASYDSEASATPGTYTINGFKSVTDSVLEVDLTGAVLVQGGLLSIDFTFNHASFSGGTLPTATTSNVTLSLFFELPQDYISVYDMVTSIDFQNRVGTTLNIQPVTGTPCDGTTFTDAFNCNIPNQLNNYTKTASGISVAGQPISVTATSGSSVFKIQLLAMQFVDSVASPAVTAYEYYEFVNSEVTYQERGNRKSLHSNRDYEIGIVYMDEFNRSTTTLVSPRNTIHFPCGTSDLQNSIQIVIPPTQVAPAWATRYKFVIKPDKAGYETIYSDIYFQDQFTNSVYLLLEGENARKVEVGDRYIVKADATGPKNTCSYATVLEKEARQANFLGFTTAPAGVYMKMNANDFAVSNDSNSKVLPGYIDDDASKQDSYPAQVNYPMNIYDSTTSAYIDYTVPEGTIIKIYIKSERPGTGDGDSLCEKRGWTFSQDFTSPANYANMYDWFYGENIFQIIQTAANASAYAGNGQTPPSITYNDALVTTGIPVISVSDYLQFARDTTNNKLRFQVTGGTSCPGGFRQGRIANIAVDIKVYRATSTLIFETLPVDSLPDVFYENELSLPIGPNGEHIGNIQDQSFGPVPPPAPAIVDTGFFNCYTFGNGAESYKIRDSIIGRTLELGNRVTSVAAQDYQQVDRFSDITYSGIYNNESNVNKLNEFNLGLLNFKNCETSFGPIYILDGRQTDVLTLQEDKISYVLAGKNLLSDSAAGGAIASVPEVLGTQIARSEKYGISFNPESYVQWGYDRYFTDAKRGAVIQMKGDSYSNDQLKVVSEMGMRTWFRDLFKNSFQTQKLGAFDPYMNEYVLSSNDIAIPQPVDCLDCGINRTFSFAEAEEVDFCVDLGLPVGDVNIVYNVQGVALNPFVIGAIYNGGSYTTGNVTSSGILTVLKDVNGVRTIDVSITANGPLILDIVVDCVRTQELTIIEVVITNDYEPGKTVHTEYRYSYGAYNSPLQSSFVTFGTQLSNFVISRYNTNAGVVGTGAFPQENSTMRLICNQFASDTFVFKPTMNSFKYLMSTDFYANNTVDMTTLLSLASTATPLTTSPSYNDATFTVPPILDYLYLIWDLRDSVETDLCFGTSGLDVCCDCDRCNNPCNSYTITNAESAFGAQVEYYECGETTPTTITVLPNRTATICNNRDYIPTIISGYADITLNNECGC
jgi:hypothetical protein